MTHPADSDDCRADAEILREITPPPKAKPLDVTGEEFGVIRPVDPREHDWIADETMQRTDK